MPVEYRKRITRDMLRAEPEVLFVFGDNLTRTGLGGQAAEMRGEPNAVGLPTKWMPRNVEVAFFTDADLATVINASSVDVRRLLDHVREGGVVVWPTDGIGTGLAQLPTRAPTIATYYREVQEALTNGKG